jgi:hypothetical protein
MDDGRCSFRRFLIAQKVSCRFRNPALNGRRWEDYLTVRVVSVRESSRTVCG